MRFRTIISLATFLLGCFAIAVWSQPLPAQFDGSRAARAENRSISGKISSVGDASFAIDVIQQNQQPQTIHFLVDDTTKVEGKLRVGAHAVVEYRTDGDANIAARVVVKSSSDVSPY